MGIIYVSHKAVMRVKVNDIKQVQKIQEVLSSLLITIASLSIKCSTVQLFGSSLAIFSLYPKGNFNSFEK